jgi:hypothetical protein
LAKTMDMHKFFSHASDAFNHWNSLSPEQRHQTWQEEILRAFARAEDARKDAQNMVDSLRQQVDHLTIQLEKGATSWNDFGPKDALQHQLAYSPYAALTSLRLSSDLMKELCKQGVDFRDWDYERLVDKWRPVVRDERRSANGLSEQKPLSATPQIRHATNASSLPRPNGQLSAFSRSASITSAVSLAPPTRTSSMDSESRDADAEGEDDDADAEHEIPTTSMGGDLRAKRLRPPSIPTPTNQSPNILQQPVYQPNLQSPTNQVSSNAQQQMYRWPPQSGASPNMARPGFARVKNLPPGPSDWEREMSAVMEGIEGPAVAKIPQSDGS